MIDDTLLYAMHYNPLPFSEDDIYQTLVIEEGERDAASWVWLVRLNDDRCFRVTGGCDYTGWDCQSWLGAEPAEWVGNITSIETRRSIVARRMAEGVD